jgi:hypothetical protein
MSDEGLYLIASEEVDSKKIDSKLWAKAEFLADEHHENIKYEYIKLRVEQLQESSEYGEPNQESNETMNNGGNYFSRHWKGENSLVWAYWVNGIVFNFVAVFLITILSESDLLGFNVWLTIMLFIYPLLIWSWVGIWRSAGHYLILSKDDSSKSSTWAYLARFGVIIGILQNIPVLVDTISLYEVGNSEMLNQYFVEYVGDTDIKLTGYINDNAVNSLISNFEQNPSRTTLLIDSPGGLLSSAFKLADYIEENDIIVAAQEKCFSACLLLLASSSTGVASTKSELAFHHPEDVTEFISSKMIQAGFEEEEEYYQRFRRYGVSEENLEAYRKEGWVNLSLGQAYEANILNVIWEEEDNQFFNAYEFCQTNNCFTIPVFSQQGTQKSIFDLSQGDCFDDAGIVDLSEGEQRVLILPCETEHDNEVFALFDLNIEAFPGNEKINDISNDECLLYFENYIGNDYYESTIEITTFHPTAESWVLGDKEVVCLAYDMNLKKLDSTVRNSKL